MILLEPSFVNSDFRIYFGTRINRNDYSSDFIYEYLNQIYDATRINKFVLMNQIHSTNIKNIANPHFTKAKNINKVDIKMTDAIYSSQRGIALCVKTADCMPVFIISGNIAGAIHMGWRGAKERIVEKFIESVLYKKGLKPDQITIITGPHIKGCCYKVGEDLIKEFQNKGFDTKRLFKKRRNNIYLSLIDSLYQQTENCKIPHQNVLNTRICTSCLNSLFYSYRKNDSGRNISFIIRN